MSVSKEETAVDAIAFITVGLISGILIQVVRLVVYGAGQAIISEYGVNFSSINLLFGLIFLVVNVEGWIEEIDKFLIKGWLFILMVAALAFVLGDLVDGTIAAITLMVSLILSAFHSFFGKSF